MKLTDLLTPELYRRWHSLEKECPGLVKQRFQRIEPLLKEFDNCMKRCGRPREYNSMSLDEFEFLMTANLLLTIDQMIEMATEPRHGTN